MTSPIITEWLRAAILRAEDVIRSGRRRLEPHRRVAPRNHLALDAEVGNREAVEHVLRDHRQLDRTPGRNVQRIDLVLSARMLRLPHPLLADDIDVHRIRRRSCRCGSTAARPTRSTTRNRASGMIVQVASSSVEPSTCVATGCSRLAIADARSQTPASPPARGRPP